jgi:hypothetical protein
MVYFGHPQSVGMSFVDESRSDVLRYELNLSKKNGTTLFSTEHYVSNRYLHTT